MATPPLRPICSELRNLIATQHPEFVEVVWPRLKIASFGVGPRKMSQHYAYISVQAKHINLGFYHGASLPDPTGTLEGTGKELRHIKVRDLAIITGAAVSDLLAAAVAERRPYE